MFETKQERTKIKYCIGGAVTMKAIQILREFKLNLIMPSVANLPLNE